MWVPQYDYLEHHGIDGQKWGHRNGPPYPLDYNDHSASEKKKNPKTRLDNYDNSSKEKKRKQQTRSDIHNTSKKDKLSKNVSKDASKKRGGVKEFAKKHKTGLIVGGITAAVVAGGIVAGTKYAQSKGAQNLSDALAVYKNALQGLGSKNEVETADKEEWSFFGERHFANGAKVTGSYRGDYEGYLKAVEDYNERSRRIRQMNYNEIAGLLPMKN